GRAVLEPPYVDRRVYVAWNCALAVALLEADLRLDRPQLRERALQLLESVFTRYAAPEGGLLHTDGVGGQLGDQVWGLLAAVRAGWEERARALDRVRRPPIKVTTMNRELARSALAADPYASVELGGDQRAVVCVGTVCLAPVATPEAVVDAVATRV